MKSNSTTITGWKLSEETVYSYRDGSLVPHANRYSPHCSTRFRNMAALDDSQIVRLPELYSRREECCGCTSCLHVCPTEAISMEPDEEGFSYPVVDAERCIACFKCMAICAFKLSSMS